MAIPTRNSVFGRFSSLSPNPPSKTQIAKFYFNCPLTVSESFGILTRARGREEREREIETETETEREKERERERERERDRARERRRERLRETERD